MSIFRFFRALSAASREADEYEAAAERWRQSNAAAKSRGCRCGKPATHVRRYGGTVGGVPFESWSCEEHQNVNSWNGLPDGTMTPAGDFDEATERWRVG